MAKPDRHPYLGRTFAVLARFTGDDRHTLAADYIAKHPHAAVLCEEVSWVIVFDSRDAGESEFKHEPVPESAWTRIPFKPHPKDHHA